MLQWIFAPIIAIGAFFAFPVSLVLRGWHWLLATALGLDPSLAWVVSVLLLVVTVRLALLPLAYQQLLNTRRLVLLRPRMRELTEYYRFHIDPEAPRHLKWQLRKLRRDNDIHLSIGCITPIIQMCVILGLYQLVRRLGAMGEETIRPHDVAFIPRQEVGTFLESTFIGAPLPAYLQMSETTLNGLGSSYEAISGVIIPLIIAATLLTAMNLTWSVFTMNRTLDHGSRFARGMYATVLVLAVVGSMFPLLFGLFGPASVAVLLYWVFNNVWTTVQSAVLWIYIERIHPLDDGFRTFRDSAIQERKELRKGGEQARTEKKEHDLKRRATVAKYRNLVRQIRASKQDQFPTMESVTNPDPISTFTWFVPDRPPAEAAQPSQTAQTAPADQPKE